MKLLEFLGKVHSLPTDVNVYFRGGSNTYWLSSINVEKDGTIVFDIKPNEKEGLKVETIVARLEQAIKYHFGGSITYNGLTCNCFKGGKNINESNVYVNFKENNYLDIDRLDLCFDDLSNYMIVISENDNTYKANMEKNGFLTVADILEIAIQDWHNTYNRLTEPYDYMGVGEDLRNFDSGAEELLKDTLINFIYCNSSFQFTPSQIYAFGGQLTYMCHTVADGGKITTDVVEKAMHQIDSIIMKDVNTRFDQALHIKKVIDDADSVFYWMPMGYMLLRELRKRVGRMYMKWSAETGGICGKNGDIQKVSLDVIRAMKDDLELAEKAFEYDKADHVEQIYIKKMDIRRINNIFIEMRNDIKSEIEMMESPVGGQNDFLQTELSKQVLSIVNPLYDDNIAFVRRV